MKKIFFGGIAILTIAAVVAFNVNIGLQKNMILPHIMANIEALASESGSDKWFSNLNWTECKIETINGPTAIYYKGLWIAAYATYTKYGNKKVCEIEFTTNTCNTADQTPCQYNN